MNSQVEVYLQQIIKKLDKAIEKCRKNGSCEINGLLLAKEIILKENGNNIK